MGTELNNIKEKIKSRSGLATFAIVPAVLCGLTLLGFQTYSLITGKSFSDLDFNIGKLWQTSENSVSQNDANVLTIFDRVTTSDLAADDIDASNLEDIKALVFSNIISKPAQLVNTDKVEKQAKYANTFDLFDLSIIEQVNMSPVVQSKQLLKYLNRLDKEYLINPNMVPKQGKWYIGVSFAPTLNYRTFSYDPAYVNGVAVDGNYRYTFGLTEDSRNKTDKAITSYSFGFDIGRRINSKITIFTGLYFAHYGEQIQVRPVDTENPNYGNASFMGNKPMYELYSSENSNGNIPFTNKYSYIEIPLGVSIDVAKFNKSKLSFDAGVNFKKLSKVNALAFDFNTDYYYWCNSDKEIFNTYGVGTITGVTLSQYFGERLELFVNPTFKYNITSTFKRPYAVDQNQYSTGLRLGFKQQIF